MPTITPTVELFGGASARVTWANMANGDIGEEVTLAEYSDRSIQVNGTFGAGGSVSIKGSNDGSTFATLTDPRGTALAITTARIERIEDCTYAIRPEVTAGDGTTALTVTMFCRRGE